MGGTFDPIHYGHLVAAEAVRTEFDIEQVLFIPTGRPPHKSSEAVTDNEHRYLMTVLATVGNPYFYTSRLEIDRPGETYTIDTIRHLRDICRKDADIFFITGADAVAEIFTWKEAVSLLGLCHFVAVTRPGYNTEKLLKDIQAIDEAFTARLHFLEVPALAISSSDIRRRVACGKAVKYLLPEVVETYMSKHELYTVDFITAYLKTHLSPRRLLHTMGVAETAVKLAAHYGVDVKKARKTALLHDCAKEMTVDERAAFCQRHHMMAASEAEPQNHDMSADGWLQPDAQTMDQPDLLHAVIGAVMAKADFGIRDHDMLNAIRYHTTGRKKMSMLEKVIFLADLIEPNRDKYSDLQELHALAYENIDAAVRLGLQCKVSHAEARGAAIHPHAIKALKYYTKQLRRQTSRQIG